MESPNDKTIKAEEDEWQVVNKKKSFKSHIPKKREMQKCSKRPPKLHERKGFDEQNIATSVSSFDVSKQAESLEKYIENLVVSLKGSAFYQQVVANLVSTEYQSLICLGLGNFSESEPARLQLAMVVGLIRDIFGNEHKTEDACVLHNEHKIFAYDPIFGEIEMVILHRLGFHTLTENRFGKIRIIDDAKTLFYMPHCPYGLYCSVLWENWSCLDQIGILGNRFFINDFLPLCHHQSFLFDQFFIIQRSTTRCFR